jgi:rod shape-determining protein MreD
MVMKNLNFFLCLAAVVLYEALFAPLVAIAGARFDLALVFTAYFALSRGSLEGMLFGFLSGFLLDVLSPSLMGWGMFLRLGLGFWMASFKDNLFLDNFYSKAVIAGLAALLLEILYQLVKNSFSPSATFYVLYRFSLPAALYTLGAALVLFYLTGRKRSREAPLSA